MSEWELMCQSLINTWEVRSLRLEDQNREGQPRNQDETIRIT